MAFALHYGHFMSKLLLYKRGLSLVSLSTSYIL